MRTSENTSLFITDLSQLVRLRLPLEVTNADRSREDNEQVMEYVNAFIDAVDAELKVPKLYKEYTLGNKEEFVRTKLISRLELVMSRLMEKKAMNCSTESLDDAGFFQEEANFFADLYFVLVTTLIDLAAIRQQDLLSVAEDPYSQLFSVVIEHMAYIGGFDELVPLMDELKERVDDYPNKPLLNNAIKEILRFQPEKEDGFVFYPSKSVNDYSLGDVLVSIDPKSEINSIEIGNLPPGVILDEENGNLVIDDPAVLVAGAYDVIIKTVDEIQGVTTHHIAVPIGGTEIPQYEVAPYRVVGSYFDGDILARPIVTEDVIPIVQAEWATDKPDLPAGVALDASSGEVIVGDDAQIQVGVYPLEVILTSQSGSQSRHEFVLSFKQDNKAIYSLKSAKRLREYKIGDVIASVADIDGKVVSAAKSTLPSGLDINARGEIAVQDPSKLKAGTYLFNVLATNAASVKSIKTLFVTMEAEINPFFYDLSGLKPIDDIDIGDIMAVLKSTDRKRIPSKVLLSKGTLPPGTSLSSNGDIVCDDPTKLIATNYDIRVSAFLEEIDPTAIADVITNLENNKQELTDRLASLETVESDLYNARVNLNEFIAGTKHQFSVLENEILEIQVKMQTATPEELQELQAQLVIKQNELTQFGIDSNASYEQKSSLVSNLETTYQEIQVAINTINESTKNLEITLAKLRSNRWTEFDVPLLLTLEEDHPSAWHISIPKDWDDYQDHEVIAQLIDCDGYSSVSIDSGVLPSGLALNVERGSIDVVNRRLLQPGEYTFNTTSIDKNNGETAHRLVIIIEGQLSSRDEEFILLKPKAANKYIDKEIIGYPFSLSYSITSARIVKGILPVGIQVDPLNGALSVSDMTLLKTGLYSGIVMKTTNTIGGVFYHEILLRFGKLTTFDVFQYPTKNILEYKINDPIFEIMVVNGTLQGIQIVQGELAPGLVLNSLRGRVEVEILQALQEGTYQVKILMIDVDGASDTQTIEYVIGSSRNGTSDPTVSWENKTPIAWADADLNTILATPSLSEGNIASASAVSLPQGIGLESTSGVLYVESQKLLNSGIYPLNINLIDELGHSYAEEITLEIGPKPVEVRQEVTWTNFTPMSHDTAKTETRLAIPSIPDADIVAAQPVSVLPKGIGLGSSSGIIFVSNQEALNPDEYQVQVQLEDHLGNQYTEAVPIRIERAGTTIEPTIIWTNNTPISKVNATSKTVLAVPILSDGTNIVDSLAQSLPSGIRLSTLKGIIYVSSQKALEPRKYPIQVSMKDLNGRTFKSEVTIEITEEKPIAAGKNVSIKLDSPSDFHTIKNGDVLSRLSPEYTVRNVQLFSGGLPEGTSLDSLKGRIVVSDRLNLERIEKTGQLKVSIDSGDSRFATISRASSSTATSSEYVDFKFALRPIPNFSVPLEITQFVDGTLDRLQEIQKEHFDDEAIKNAVWKYYEPIEKGLSDLVEYMGTAEGKAMMLKGERDGIYFKMYLAVAEALVKDIPKISDPKVMDALIDLYNEFVTTLLALGAYRSQDISSYKNNPISQMIVAMDHHLGVISKNYDVLFIRENASMIFKRLLKSHKNLMVRYFQLLS